MPFVKVSRDKRGYEQISLVHVSARRGRPSKARVLYVFRTPPGVKVGREPFDEAIQRELEAQNPGVVFDWKMLSNIPAPAPDVEFWRERRKADKAAKLARKAEEQADAAEELDASEPVSPDAIAVGLAAIEDLLGRETPDTDTGDQGLPIDDGPDADPADVGLIDSTAEIAAPGAASNEGRPLAPVVASAGGWRRHRGSLPVPLSPRPG